MAKITEDELVARIQGEVTDALGYGDTVSQQREKAMEYYQGSPLEMRFRGAASM